MNKVVNMKAEDDDMVLANMSSPAGGTFAVYTTDEGHAQLPVVSFAVFEASDAEETAALGMVSFQGDLLIAEQELEDYGMDFLGYWVSSCESLEVFLQRIEEPEEDNESPEVEDEEEDSVEEVD